MLLKIATLGRLNAVCRSVLSGILDFQFLNLLVETGSLREVAALLKSTSYSQFVVGEGRDELLKGVEIYFEHLVKKVFKIYPLSVVKRFFSVSDRASLLKEMLEMRELRGFACVYCDFLDITTILKYRVIEGLVPERVAASLLAKGKLSQLLPELLEVSTLEGLSSLLQFTEGADSFESFRRELYRFHVGSLKRLLFGNPLNPIVALVVLRLKEIEKMNLISVIEGISENLPSHQIEEMLIDIS